MTTPDTFRDRSAVSIVLGLAIAAVLAVLVAASTGCVSNPRKTATADIEIQAGTNSVRIRQPKDTTIGRLTWSPGTGFIEVLDYASTVNAGLVAAGRQQSESTRDGFLAGFSLMRELGVTGAAAWSGQPITSGSSAGALKIPAGMKAVQRGGEVVLVPKDDPSQPHLEIQP